MNAWEQSGWTRRGWRRYARRRAIEHAEKAAWWAKEVAVDRKLSAAEAERAERYRMLCAQMHAAVSVAMSQARH